MRAEPANDQLDADEGELEQRQRFRHFLLDYGYEPGEKFCRELLSSGEFSPALLGRFCQVGFKSLPKEQVAGHVAARLMNDEISADDLMLAFCQQPRDWLCLRLGNKVNLWPQMGTGQQFFTERDKGPSQRLATPTKSRSGRSTERC